MGLLRTIFLILLFYYGLKYLMRLLAPFMLKKAAEKMQEKSQQQQYGDSYQTSVKEGETVIDKAPRNQQKSNNDVGEYVDFEEIDKK